MPDVKFLVFGDFPTVINDNATPVTVGKHFSSLTAPFNGTIDDPRVYNRALSDEEIARLASGLVEATFLLVDAETIDTDTPSIEALADGMGVDPADLVNDAIADKGVRDVLPIPVGTVLTLPTGQVGDEGWFALKTIPASWDAPGPTADGLRNYVGPVVGAGLGTGDDPEVLLDKIPDVTPLRTAGLQLLVGETVCALVYDSDISTNYDPLEGNLQGANLGLIAFDVLAVGPPSGSSVLPEMTVEIVDAVTAAGDDACEGDLTLLDDVQAPPPISSSEPPQ